MTSFLKHLGLDMWLERRQPGDLQAKCSKYKISSSDPLCTMSIDHNHCAEDGGGYEPWWQDGVFGDMDC